MLATCTRQILLPNESNFKGGPPLALSLDSVLAILRNLSLSRLSRKVPSLSLDIKLMENFFADGALTELFIYIRHRSGVVYGGI